MSKLLFIPFFIFYCNTINAQVKRSFLYKGQSFDMLAQNNRMENSFSFPGLRMYIIVGEADQPLDSIYAMDKLRQIPVTGMNDYACFYYIAYNQFLKDSSAAGFLAHLITYCYEEDLTNRNSVHLVWENSRDTIPCKVLYELNNIVSTVAVLAENHAISCDIKVIKSLTPEEVWQKSRIGKTAVSYKRPGLKEMEEREKEKQRRTIIATFRKKKNNLFIQLTAGGHFIENQYKTDFDTTTLVDFTKHKTLWNIRSGYYFSNRVFANIDLAFIYSGKQKNIDGIDWGNSNGITVRGSGHAGAMIRYGVGIGWLPYSKKRLDLVVNIETGRLKAIAGGGNATRTIGGTAGNNTNIVKEKEKSIYFNLRTGINYMLGNAIYFTGNLQYIISGFKKPIGSVSAFTGWSYTLGFGFTIPAKK